MKVTLGSPSCQGGALPVIVLMMVLAMSGCFGPEAGSDGNAPEILRLDPLADADRAKGLHGVELFEDGDRIAISFAFEPGHGNDVRDLRCDAWVNGTIEHRMELSPVRELRTAQIIDQNDTEILLAAPLERMAVMTWYEAFDVECTARFHATGRALTEAGSFHWTTMPEIGDPAHAFGVGPFFDDENKLQAEECNVHTNRPDEGAEVDVICFPPNQLDAVSIWQNDTTLFLKAGIEADPLENAVLIWYYRSSGDVFISASEYRYSVETGSAHHEDKGPITAARNGNEITLEIPRSMLDDRQQDDYIRWNVHLRADDGPTTYLYGHSLPPYLFGA